VKEDGSGTEAQGTGAAGDRDLCEHVFDHYERFGDAERTTNAFPPLGGGGSSERVRAPWLRADLWHAFTFACTSGGGCGLSQQELRRLYRFTMQVEAASSASRKPFTAAFHNANRFIASVRRFKRSLVAALNWKKVVMAVDGRKYRVFFRDTFDAVQEEVLQVELGDLCWGAAPSPAGNGMEAPQSTQLRGSWDGEMYREQHAHVQGTMPEDTRVLAMHLYSDATVLSSSGAVSAYPLRMRIVNVNTKNVRWMTLAYIPQVEAKFLETRKGQEVRSELLQRILHIVFRRSVLASHRGAWLNLPVDGRVLVSPRALLYVCYQPEQRAVMCLKGPGCICPCTPCMVEREGSCSASGADAPSRDVDETVRAQLRNSTMGSFRGAAARRAEVELEHSLNSVVPAMAAWAGLGNGPRMM